MAAGKDSEVWKREFVQSTLGVLLKAVKSVAWGVEVCVISSVERL